jgi:hypothetical protein
MTKEEFFKTIKPYAVLYNIDLLPEISRMWFESCNRNNVSAEALKVAFNRYVDTSTDRWFPLPGQVLVLVERNEQAFSQTEEGKRLFREMEEAKNAG